MALAGPRAVQPAELPALMDLVNGVFRPGQTGDVMGSSYPYLFNPSQCQNLRIFARNGQPVSHVGVRDWDVVVSGLRFPLAHVGAVCTHADERGQGLATRLMHDALEQMRRRGVAVASISGARWLYRRLGAHPVGRLARVQLPAGLQASLPGRSRAERMAGQDLLVDARLEQVVALYRSGVPRYGRRRDDWPMLVRAQELRAAPRRCLQWWLLTSEDGDVVLAYALVAVPAERRAPEDDPPPDAQVLEWGGERTHAAALMCWGTGGLDSPLQVDVPHAADPLVSRLQQNAPALQVEGRSLPGTMIIVDAPAAVSTLAPALAERWSHGQLAALQDLAAGDGAEERTAVLHLLLGIDDETVTAQVETFLRRGWPELAGQEPSLRRVRLPSPSGMHYV